MSFLIERGRDRRPWWHRHRVLPVLQVVALGNKSVKQFLNVICLTIQTDVKKGIHSLCQIMNSGPQDIDISLSKLLSGHWNISVISSPTFRTHLPVVSEGVHNMLQWHHNYFELKTFENPIVAGRYFFWILLILIKTEPPKIIQLS